MNRRYFLSKDGTKIYSVTFFPDFAVETYIENKRMCYLIFHRFKNQVELNMFLRHKFSGELK